MFTLKEGFLEALVRGMKAELLVKEDYIKLRQCDSLVDLKLYLVSRGYHSELHSEIGPISPTRLVELCAKKLVKGFRTINTQVLTFLIISSVTYEVRAGIRTTHHFTKLRDTPLHD